MHKFSLLVEGCVGFTSSRLDDTIREIETRLAERATTVEIKNLQSVKLQYTITAVGMFSIFDAQAQRAFGAADGFAAIREALLEKGRKDLHARFDQLTLAINVLKHGEGRSYDQLLRMQDQLPFKVKNAPDDFFDHGDCSEIDTLVDADSRFLKLCADVIYDVSDVIGI